MRDKQVLLENSFSPQIALQLGALGHDIQIAADSVQFGRGQMILKGNSGSLIGGTEKRTDSSIACY
jgi:gamma-glutamyltranspeptidase/glutathione hydrolase